MKPSESWINTVFVSESEFASFYKKGDLRSVRVVGDGSKGFYIAGKLGNSSSSQCFLSGVNSEIRYIKSPDYAHQLLTSMSVRSFRVDVTNWNPDSTFNPHEASSMSRKKNKHFKSVIRTGEIYLGKANKIFGNRSINIIIDNALKNMWVDGAEVSFRCCEGNIKPWVIASAVELVTNMGILPQSKEEIIVYLHVLNHTSGPIRDSNEFYEKAHQKIKDLINTDNDIARSFIAVVESELPMLLSKRSKEVFYGR